MALVEFVVVSSRQLGPKRPERLMKKLKTISKIPVVSTVLVDFVESLI